jgi:hypothetical protein
MRHAGGRRAEDLGEAGAPPTAPPSFWKTSVVFDVYQGAGLPEGKKSLAFNLVFRASTGR